MANSNEIAKGILKAFGTIILIGATFSLISLCLMCICLFGMIMPSFVSDQRTIQPSNHPWPPRPTEINSAPPLQFPTPAK